MSVLDDLLGTDFDIDRWERRLRKTTGNIVREHRAAIKRVTNLLVRQGTLTADDVEREIDAVRNVTPTVLP
ncbi:MAG TPA: hypothetical protein VEJ16_17130 [Alphaproteobacteria bacterium]|nr:hypothetical protein [Alphaproteobacteria bacterium]